MEEATKSGCKASGYEEANEFLEQWKYNKKAQYRYEIVHLERGTKPKKPLYGPDHPLAKLIEAKERSLFLMASDWYNGRDPNKNYEDLGYSKSTFYRHRKSLLKYGVDITKEPDVVFFTPKPKTRMSTPFNIQSAVKLQLPL